MKCTECRGTMKTKRENYRYAASGLPVTLAGVKVSRCSKCGAHEVAIPRIEELHRVIALAVISKSGRLAAPEIRFLRKFLDWSGAELARHVGVDVATVSRWENGQQPMGPIADRLLRMIVGCRQPDQGYSVEKLIGVRGAQARPTRIDVREAKGAWRAEAA
ncbi:MAG: type II toxin-antitoxin system MqsA family antitoxin [Acidobacteria bacterium]|nr:type II toxin-antitoxin system MqsA family antitoxin [Acidobacteriota bacterium]